MDIKILLFRRKIWLKAVAQRAVEVVQKAVVENLVVQIKVVNHQVILDLVEIGQAPQVINPVAVEEMHPQNND
jgi:hypothetical protein